MDEGLPWLRPKPWAKTPFGGHFELRDGDSVVFTGGENTLAGQQSAYLETRLTIASSPRRLFFRNMAWEGDTVHEQWRILNFGPWPYQLRRVGATVVIAQFGQSESLQGKAGLPGFVQAYNQLLDQFAAVTHRIVLISPTPFEKSVAPMPDLSRHNEDVGLYTDAIRDIAAQRGLLFVDLFSSLQKPASERPLTRDGMHLLAYGQWRVAEETCRQLGIKRSYNFQTSDSDLRFSENRVEKLRDAIGHKNAAWLSYWRPGNWAFLNGDRITQPSSRDHQDPRVRWFPAEVQEFPAMIDRQEQSIQQLAQSSRARGTNREAGTFDPSSPSLVWVRSHPAFCVRPILPIGLCRRSRSG